jgi:hypothetical protein
MGAYAALRRLLPEMAYLGGRVEAGSQSTSDGCELLKAIFQLEKDTQQPADAVDSLERRTDGRKPEISLIFVDDTHTDVSRVTRRRRFLFMTNDRVNLQ